VPVPTPGLDCVDADEDDDELQADNRVGPPMPAKASAAAPDALRLRNSLRSNRSVSVTRTPLPRADLHVLVLAAW
jgi:hypothetical protein